MRAVTVASVGLDELEAHRRELTGYCYRMLGSGSEAEDAVQETMLRAWRAVDGFEGRSTVRSWLYRIATNVCVDMMRSPQRRARPHDLAAPSPPDERHLAALLRDRSWISPIPDARVVPDASDPADIAATRESIRLAFVSALQHLPPRQRAVLILCEVLRWPAAEVAELLDSSVAAVNSALQRARATMASVRDDRPAPALDADLSGLLERYVDAFERYDVETLVSLLHEDAVQTMPPYAMWLKGSADIAAWFRGPGCGCRGSKLLPTAASGWPAFAQYRVDPAGGHAPWSLQVLEISGDKISGFHAFLDTSQFARFDLPDHLPA
jgi:RNA polymerase sigma-70 factor (ECF subfamily)